MASTGARGSRGEECTFNKSGVVIPADDVPTTLKMAAGKRALHFRWQDGRPPYQLTITNNKTGETVANAKGILGCQITLSEIQWTAGVYTLNLKDSLHKEGWTDKELTFVNSAEVPRPPKAIAEAQVTDAAKSLLYADWLAYQGDFGWRMEAIQLAAPYEDWDMAAQWLSLWGGKAAPQ